MMVESAMRNGYENEMMNRNAEAIQSELQGHQRISRQNIKCSGCGYEGRMGLTGTKKAQALVISERVLYSAIALFFFASYFAENQALAFTIRMVIPALVFVIFIYIEQKLKTYSYSCPNCSALTSLRGSR